jgi:hypothetical protein
MELKNVKATESIGQNGMEWRGDTSVLIRLSIGLLPLPSTLRTIVNLPQGQKRVSLKKKKRKEGRKKEKKEAGKKKRCVPCRFSCSVSSLR